jgi:FtsP/CotA-like multicopper oxidase with cupredoxin domain
LSRRTALTGAAALAAATTGGVRAVAAHSAAEFRQPDVLKSENGELSLTLEATPAVVEMGAERPVTTYTFDGIVPGKTWEVNPGDTIRIDLVNNLPALPHDPNMSHVRPHDWTVTNLHTHGLQVSPEGNADNVFLEIQPGASQHYDINLPDTHPGGIFWYHPHHHGGVAQQVRGGMAGMIVVRGAIDEVAEVRAAKEQIMVLQAIEVGEDYQLLDPIPNPTKEQAFYPRKHILYTVNGVLNPKITMYPGEVQRWRMVNAAEGKFLSLHLTEHDMNVLAWDGLTLAAPDATDVVMLSSGNRVEMLIKAGEPGIYELMLQPGSSQKPNIPGMPDSDMPFPVATQEAAASPMAEMPGMLSLPGELDLRSILTVEVVGTGPEMQLPGSLPVWDPPMLPIAKTREFAFTVSRDPDNEFLSFGVDGEAFDPDREPYQVTLGTAEEWTLTNALDTKLEDHAHVYHIHANPFKITKINGKLLDTPLWRDTFVLTKSTGDSITFESNFVDFTGRFVEHCHVLTHEDLGMMAAVEVVP